MSGHRMSSRNGCATPVKMIMLRYGDNFHYGFKGARSAPHADGASSPRVNATWQDA